MYQLTPGALLYLKLLLFIVKFKCNWVFCIGSSHPIPSSTELTFQWGGTVEMVCKPLKKRRISNAGCYSAWGL